MNIAAQTQQLSIAFAGKTIINDISVTIPAKQITVFIGRSGSGKTTFLRAFNRLNEEHHHCQTKGQLQLDLGNGLKNITTISGGSLSALRLQVGMLFQTPNVLPISIGNNIALPLEKLTATVRHTIPAQVEKSLKAVGLWDEVHQRLNTPASQLSGGQQQRLCLARILALEPKILLLDEPTASLDIVAAKQIEQLLQKLSQHYTIIMVSHSLSQACRLADKLLVFDNGQVVKMLDKQDEATEEQLMQLMMGF